jgi:2-polyprenyl-3-methyl-5-hydroxy-6-metoxy-1,4-benzoquinol methylase
MEKAVQENLALWNEWTRIHEKSKMYNIEGFLAGENRLHSIELDELGAQVPGRSMLHLQCHFGLDSLSWARLGAQVTGADFSGEAIRLAKALNEKAGLSARFVCSELDKLPGVLEGQFDIVYTSYGVLTWLPDLTRWAQVIDHFLKPGGTFYMVEFHPYFMTLDDADNAQGVKIGYTYFHTMNPLKVKSWDLTPTGLRKFSKRFVMNGVTGWATSSIIYLEWGYSLSTSTSSLTASMDC